METHEQVEHSKDMNDDDKYVPRNEKGNRQNLEHLEDEIINDLLEDKNNPEDTESSQKSFSSEFDVLSEIAEGHEFEQPFPDVTDKVTTKNLLETEALPSKRRRKQTGHYSEEIMSLKKDLMILKPKKVKNQSKRMDTSLNTSLGFSSKRKPNNCKSCDGCLREDCGECRNCRDKKKFGGSNKIRQKCVQRKCRMSVL